jgi:CHAD domain-containing protein
MRVGSSGPIRCEGTQALTGEPIDIKPHCGPAPGVAPVAEFPQRAGIPAGPQPNAAELKADASLQEAIATAAGGAVSQFRTNTAPAEAGNAEGIHQMRVALRRLRSIFVLFAPCCDHKATRHLNMAIREMGAPLGIARDWDVFAIQTLPQAMKDDVGEDLLAELARMAQIRREKAHAMVRRLIHGEPLSVLVRDIEIWVTEGKWRTAGSEAATTPVLQLLPALLDRMLRKVEKRAKALSHLSAKELHPLRKSIKKLRYSAEDAAVLFKRKRVDDFVKQCKTLQALLGEINDAATTARFIEELGNAGKSEGACALLAWNERRCAHARSRLAPAWHKFHSADPFWR